MDHTYIKSRERIPGFQVIQDEWRAGPGHTYVRYIDSCTPQKLGSKRLVSTPTGMTPKHKNKRIELDEKIKHNRWSTDQKSFLREYSQASRKEGVSENSFWNKCATAMNNQFGGKNGTGQSCKMAAWRLNLTSSSTVCTPTADDDLGDFKQLPERSGTEWYFLKEAYPTTKTFFHTSLFY